MLPGITLPRYRWAVLLVAGPSPVPFLRVTMTPELPAYCENPTLCVNCGSSAVCPPWALCHRCLGGAGPVEDVRTDCTPRPDDGSAEVATVATCQPTAGADPSAPETRPN